MKWEEVQESLEFYCSWVVYQIWKALLPQPEAMSIALDEPSRSCQNSLGVDPKRGHNLAQYDQEEGQEVVSGSEVVAEYEDWAHGQK
jgi:hypothetical protein